VTDQTIIAIVTIICTMITTVVGLIVRSGVIALIKTVGEQTKELASMHQTVIAQSAKIYDQEATKTSGIKPTGRQPHQPPTDEPYTAMPPYRSIGGRKDE
jgi:hypothetical protein